MSMSKKHYVAIAAILRDAQTVEQVRDELADYLATDNPNFNRQTFIEASMPQVNIDTISVMGGNKYKIVRKFFNSSKRDRVIDRGLTLGEAKDYCKNPETSSSTCTSASKKRYTKLHGEWFDGYTKE